MAVSRQFPPPWLALHPVAIVPLLLSASQGLGNADQTAVTVVGWDEQVEIWLWLVWSASKAGAMADTNQAQLVIGHGGHV